jgi:hypothetical protein
LHARLGLEATVAAGILNQKEQDYKKNKNEHLEVACEERSDPMEYFAEFAGQLHEDAKTYTDSIAKTLNSGKFPVNIATRKVATAKCVELLASWSRYRIRSINLAEKILND